jgi:hypothetical protein
LILKGNEEIGVKTYSNRIFDLLGSHALLSQQIGDQICRKNVYLSTPLFHLWHSFFPPEALGFLSPYALNFSALGDPLSRFFIHTNESIYFLACQSESGQATARS